MAAAVEMFIKPCSFKQGGGGSGGSAEERRRKVSELRADFARQAASDDPTKNRRRKVSDLREELSRQASDEQARNRRRKASELREAFARRAEIKEGRQEEQRRRREKSQEGPSPLSLYRVLGVDDEASNKEIRKAFLEKVREFYQAISRTRLTKFNFNTKGASDNLSKADSQFLSLVRVFPPKSQ